MSVNGTAHQPGERAWPEEGVTRVPFWVYQDQEIYASEQRKIYQGSVWNYLCLEAEVAKPGDYRTTFVGDMPIIVTRDQDDEIYAFENRCSHRGSLLALENQGNTREFACVYHAWTFDLQGSLKGVAFKDGLNGKGGMPAEFCLENHNPKKLRIATVHGLVFGSLSDDVAPIEEYLGEAILGRIKRVLGGRTTEVIGRFTQALPNNWKLYFENTKDSYHASLLHLFFTTFRLNRLNMKGGILLDESGGHHVSYSMVDPEKDKSADYSDQGIRSESGFTLADPNLLKGFKEFPDGITLQLLSVFPGFVLQQIQNCIAIRQIVPRGTDKCDLNWTYIGFADDTKEQRSIRLKQSNLIGPGGFVSMEDGCVGGFVQRGIAGSSEVSGVLEMGGNTTESQDTRVTEASVRGFWKAYRSLMSL
ncbi:MAG: Rieske (2Fe-2S) protein [Rhodocyclaceae bacterium]|nr:MAG: Rieske (2Fe-2S) protein [Rhodocyclaceae bacterium]